MKIRMFLGGILILFIGGLCNYYGKQYASPNSTGSVTPSEVVFAIIIIAGITIAVYGGVTSPKRRSNVPSQEESEPTVTYLQPAAYVADIKFCKSCGGKIRTHLRFCNLCGAEQ